MALNIFLNDFIERFNNKDIVKHTVFTELYDEYIIPSSNQLINEINENMLELHISDRKNYLKYVRKKIDENIIIYCDESNIEKWLQGFKLNSNEFPFDKNKKIKIKLATWHNQPGLKYDFKIELLKMHKDFYLHTFYLESCKIIKIIDDYLLQISISPSAIEKIELKYFKIKAGYSRKQKALRLFNTLVTNKCIDSNSKEDFINAFTGTPPLNKINWIGSFGDLKTMINHSIEVKYIEKVFNKWVFVANMFQIDGVDFTSQQIKDTKETSNSRNIKIIINSIF